MTAVTRSGRITVVGSRDGQHVRAVEGGHREQALVELGSLTKTITAAAVSVLASQGLDLRAPLETYLPVPAGTGVTAELLLEHRAGLPRLGPGVRPGARDPYRAYDRDQLLRVLAELPRVLVRAPGAAEEYSNLGYAVLGELVGRVDGAGWYAAVRRLVLDPCALTDIVLRPEPGRALVGAGRLGRAREPWSLDGAMAPAGGLWGTAPAAAGWLAEAVLRQRFGPPGPAWGRMGPAVWCNGATRDASVLAAALPDTGDYVLVHALGRRPQDTDEHGLRQLADLRGAGGAGGAPAADVAAAGGPDRARDTDAV